MLYITKFIVANFVSAGSATPDRSVPFISPFPDIYIKKTLLKKKTDDFFLYVFLLCSDCANTSFYLCYDVSQVFFLSNRRSKKKSAMHKKIISIRKSWKEVKNQVFKRVWTDWVLQNKYSLIIYVLHCCIQIWLIMCSSLF
jgi:hypothetical protein